MLNNQLICLLSDKTYVVYVSGKNEWINGLGVIDTSLFIDKDFGDFIKILGFEFKIIRPTIEDILDSIERSAQAINKKDLGTIIFKSGIKNDSKVVEIGIGSGFLTITLLYYLSNGKLISYDISKKNAENVLVILKRFNLDERWEYKIKDLKDGIEEKNIDAIFMDVPEPWLSLDKTKNSLKSGGSLLAYLPNITQVKEFVEHIEEMHFKNIEIIELIERPWKFGKLELRPENVGLLHTSFLVFSRRF